MSKKKVFIHILGARPNFIKASPIVKELEKFNIESKILHTGQHYDFQMSEQFFMEFALPQPFHNLNIGSLSHGAQTGRMIEGIEKILINNKTDFIIIYGDTNSTVAGALAAVKLNIPIAHIEGGVRTLNINSPEEINRRICDQISSINFTPTLSANNNLIREGYSKDKVFFAGDVMYDMAINSNVVRPKNFNTPKDYVLATIHRQEHTDNNIILKSIFKELIKLSNIIPVIMPLHPRTKSKLIEEDIYDKVKTRLELIEPQEYNNLLYYIKSSKMVISDSGGVPKEAAFLGVPSIFIGENIVWQELVDQEWTSLLIPKNINQLESHFKKIMNKNLSAKLSGFGNGDASIKIAEILAKFKYKEL